MSHTAASTHGAHHDPLSRENVTLAGPHPMGFTLVGVGLVLAVVALIAGFIGAGGVTLKHALAAYHIGSTATLAICLGAMALVMVFHLTNAGWSATVRRQFENVMAFTPVAALLVLPTIAIEIATHGKLFLWLSPEWANDHLLHKKAGYFFWPQLHEPGHATFPVFFVIRAALYLFVWTYLSRRLWKLSVLQDATGDRFLSLKARFTSSWGILVFALSTAFAAFDWLMALDFRYFSTMWGVYYFAGAIYCGVSVVVLILASLRRAGKLEGVVTSEHFHDLGKLMFAFTVFWAYIAFSQYFLTWYANIPEETSYFLHRQSHGWQNLGIILMAGHFGAPFLILIFRGVKKSYNALTFMALWAILMHLCDIAWIIRPMAYLPTAGDAGPGVAGVWLDAVGIAACPLILTGFLLRKVGSGTLVATNDPYMPESLHHKNYV